MDKIENIKNPDFLKDLNNDELTTLGKDIRKYSSSCKYEKNGTTYTFWITDEETKKESSFDCNLVDGKLRCPLENRYHKEYINLNKN